MSRKGWGSINCTAFGGNPHQGRSAEDHLPAMRFSLVWCSRNNSNSDVSTCHSDRSEQRERSEESRIDSCFSVNPVPVSECRVALHIIKLINGTPH